MNRATSRTILRRRLMEVNEGGGNWTDDALNDLLNLGAVEAQKIVEEHQPGAFLSVFTQDIVAGQELYPKPAGLWYETRVAILDTDLGKYVPIGQLGVDVNRRRIEGLEGDAAAAEQLHYSQFGTYFSINPIPQVLVTNGLEVTFVPTLSWAADSDILPLHLGLHMLPVAWAHRFAIGETGEKADEVRDLIARLEAKVPFWYRQSLAPGAQNLVPDFVKDYR
jgi:hypothetical protein